MLALVTALLWPALLSALPVKEEKFFLDGVKTDLSNYVQNVNLVGTDTNGLLLAFPDKSSLPATWNISLVAATDPFQRATVANLMIIGAAGYLLSFLPKEVFRSLIRPLENAQTSLISRNEEDDDIDIPLNLDNFNYDNFVDPFDEYLQPSESFVQPFSLPLSDKKVRRRGDKKRKDIGFFENIGRQFQSWFGGKRERVHPQRRQRQGAQHFEGSLESREPRYEYQDNVHHKEELLQTEEDVEEEEDIGFFKKVEKAIASLFLESPIARVSEETGIGSLVDKFSNFWNENFSWEEGKYSPKNILAPKEEEEEEDEVVSFEAEARDERKLYDDSETEMENVEEIISEIYDDEWQTMQADSSYKSAAVIAERTEEKARSLMTDSLEPPPPPSPSLL